MEMDSNLKRISLNFSKFSETIYYQCTMNYSYCKTLIDVLVLNFKAMLSRASQKDGFLYSFGRKTAKVLLQSSLKNY